MCWWACHFIIYRSWQTPRWRHLGKVILVSTATSIYCQCLHTFIHIVNVIVMSVEGLHDDNDRLTVSIAMLCSLFSAQCWPTAPVLVPLSARPARRTGTGEQSVHCWSDRKVWHVLYIWCVNAVLLSRLLPSYCSSEIIQTEDLCIERGKVTAGSPTVSEHCGRRLL